MSSIHPLKPPTLNSPFTPTAIILYMLLTLLPTVLILSAFFPLYLLAPVRSSSSNDQPSL
jgi:hypothetical protein